MRFTGRPRRYYFYAIALGLGLLGLFFQYRRLSDAKLADLELEREQIARREQMLEESRAREREIAQLHAQERAKRAAIEERRARQGTIATLDPEVWTLTTQSAQSEDDRPAATLSGLSSADPRKPPQYRDVLAHEIVRQAWLIALRDGLGMRTRDESIGESLPADTQSDTPPLCFEIHARVARDQVEVVLMRRTEDEHPMEVWRRQTPSNAKPAVDYSELLEIAERWSREDFVEALKEQGLSATTTNPTTNAPLDTETAERLQRINYLDQFLAIRQLHHAIQEEGASSRLIGGLVQAYANLGMLTEFHWSQAHKAIQARAALYAQRLCHEQPESPWGLWHRSYALALAGLHKQALDDQDAAAKLAADASDETQSKPPVWVEVVNAYCRFDNERLADFATEEEMKQLASMLHFLTIESPETPTYTIDTGMAALRLNPENFRIVDSLCDVGTIGTLHQLTEVAPAVLRAILLQRLPQSSEVPEELAKSLESAALKRQVDEAKIVEQLFTVGREDRSEPSWSSLAQIVSETHFVHVWRRAYFMRFQWSVSAEEYLQQSWPLVAQHRHRQHVQQILYDVGRARETAADILPRLDRMALPLTKQAEIAKLLLRCGVDSRFSSLCNECCLTSSEWASFLSA